MVEKAPGPGAYPVDEEKEDMVQLDAGLCGIEIFGGNLPVDHHRQCFIKTAGNSGTDEAHVAIL